MEKSVLNNKEVVSGVMPLRDAFVVRDSLVIQ